MTFGLLATFAIFTVLGFARGDARTCSRCSRRPGSAGVLLSIFLVLQIVPVLHDRVRVGRQRIGGSARPASTRATSRRRSTRRCSPACLFYVIIIGVVTYVYPWQEIVSGHVRTEVAFERHVQIARASRS